MKLTALSIPEGLGARIVLAALAPIVVVGLALLVVPRVTGLPQDAAFRVGDAVVTEHELQNRVGVLEALYGIRQPSDGEQRDKFRRDSAKAVAVSLVLDNAARDRRIVIADKTARDLLTKMVDEQFGSDGRRAFIELLGNAGASERDVIDEIKRQQSTAQLLDDVTSDVPEVTDYDLRRTYEERRSELVMPEQRHLRNIVRATRQEADQVLERARSGTDFATVAQETSLDQSTRDAGGDLGLLTREQLEAAYADLAFAAPAGSLFGPVENRFGWNVGQVVEVRPATPLRFQEIKEELRSVLRSERVTEAWHDWLAREFRSADVEYADEYRPARPDAPPDGLSSPSQGGTGSQPAPPASTPR